MTRRLSGILDFMRWLSAVAVVVAHVANLMVARITETPKVLRTPLDYVWIFSAGFGHQAVVTFFVLSGFLVGGPLVLTCRRDHVIPWKKYLIDRFVRIYLVLIPALALCFLMDRITFWIRPTWVGPFVPANSGIGTFLGNLLDLQGFYFSFFGTNGPIATLAMEMWYYVSFPLLLSAFCDGYGRPKRTALLSLGVVLNIVLGIAQPAYLLGFMIWGIGAAARVTRLRLFTSATAPAALTVGALLAIRAVMRRQMSENMLDLFIADLVLATALYMLLTTELHLPESRSSMFLWPGHKWLASFSYSLYAIHMPLLFLLTALSKIYFGFGIEDVVARPFEWLLVLAVVCATMLFAFLFSLVTEKRTASARKLTWTLIGGRAVATPISEQVSLSSR